MSKNYRDRLFCETSVFRGGLIEVSPDGLDVSMVEVSAGAAVKHCGNKDV